MGFLSMLRSLNRWEPKDRFWDRGTPGPKWPQSPWLIKWWWSLLTTYDLWDDPFPSHSPQWNPWSKNHRGCWILPISPKPSWARHPCRILQVFLGSNLFLEDEIDGVFLQGERVGHGEFWGLLKLLYSPPTKTNTCPLKIDGWKMIHFLFGEKRRIFSGTILVFGGVTSLPFSRFSAIKGLSKPLACPTLGPSFWGVGAIAMRCSPKKWMSNLLGVTGKTSYLLLMVQNSQGQPLVMLIKPLKKKQRKT